MKKFFFLKWNRFLKILGIIAIVLFALIPAYRLASVALNVGENNLSNDYLAFSKTIIPIMNNGFSVIDLGQTCFRGQCEPLTMYLIAFMAKISYWNVRLEITFSIIVALATALLIYFLVAGITFHPKKLWALIFISAFSFSFTLISTYTFGQASVYTTTAFFGLCVGLFGIKFLANTYKGVALLILGGWISVWSYGAGLLSIPILFVGLIAGFRKRNFYFIWIASLLIIAIPYFQASLLNQANSTTKIELISLLRVDWVVQLVGLFFSNGFGLSPFSTQEIIFKSDPMLFGYFGISLLVLGAVLVLRFYGIKNIYLFFPEMGLLMFGLGTAWIISVIRAGIVPWYVSNVVPFWIGLAGIYFSLIVSKAPTQFFIPRFVKILAIAFFVLVMVLFIHSNIQYEDKIFHIISRAPASVSCLRDYQIAPTFCEPYLYQWEPGQPESIFTLGAALKKYELSVFAPSQEWSLQGDYPFNSVHIYTSAKGENPYWIDDGGNISSWNDYHRLNLALPATSSIEWELDVPTNLIDGKFSTQAAINPFGKTAITDQTKVSLDIVISPAENSGGETQKYSLPLDGNHAGWIPIEFPINSYKGKKIRVSIMSVTMAGETSAVIVLKYPKIDLDLQGTLSNSSNTYSPENVVDVKNQSNLIQLFPINSNKGIDISQISYINLSLDPVNKTLTNEKNRVGGFSFQNKGNFCISNDTYFYMTITADKNSGSSPSRYYSDIAFSYITSDGESVNSQVVLPMLRDGDTHTYTYPLKLLRNPSYITGLEIAPMANHEEIGYNIHNIGFYNDGISTSKCIGSPMVDILPKEPAIQIIKKDIVSQTFIAECNGLSQVQLLFGTYLKKNSHPVIVTISEINNGLSNLIFKDTIPPDTLNDNSWYRVNFPEVDNSKNMSFQIDISSPDSRNGDAVTVWQSDKDVYPLGSEYVNGKPVSKDVSFRYVCTITP